MPAAPAVFESPDLPSEPSLSGARPIDLAHLAVQTMGDRALEAEVLQLFARQARGSLQELAADNANRKAVAHKLKGAAAAVGAFNVAAAAALVESGQQDAAALAAVGAAVVEAEHFILKLLRG